MPSCLPVRLRPRLLKTRIFEQQRQYHAKEEEAEEEEEEEEDDVYFGRRTRASIEVEDILFYSSPRFSCHHYHYHHHHGPSPAIKSACTRHYAPVAAQIAASVPYRYHHSSRRRRARSISVASTSSTEKSAVLFSTAASTPGFNHCVELRCGRRRRTPRPRRAMTLAHALGRGDERDLISTSRRVVYGYRSRATEAVFLNVHMPKPPRRTKLLDLPDEILRYIVSILARHDGEQLSRFSEAAAIEVCTLRRALPLLYTCRRMCAVVYSALDNVCVWSEKFNDNALKTLAMNAGNDLKRLVLRSCEGITDDAVLAVAKNVGELRSIDLSFLSLITDKSVVEVCKARQHGLKKILLRKCANITDIAVRAVAMCTELEVVDISYLPAVTDESVRKLAENCGSSLRLFSISHDTLLTDASFSAIGKHCTNLSQICARCLPRISDVGFEMLCRGIGKNVNGIDVLDCTSLTRDPVLHTIRKYCPKIYANLNKDSADKKSLRQILVTTLRSNIFIVHGCDPGSGKETIHMVLVDNGDILSANILSAGTTDLSLLGVVLCKSYGSSLDDETKAMLSRNYGILPSMLAE